MTNSIKHFLGYTKNADSEIEIVSEEAEIIREIYERYLSGESLYGIKCYLEEKRYRRLPDVVYGDRKPFVPSYQTRSTKATPSYVLEFLIYKKAFGGGNYNIAQAVSVTVLLFAVIIIIFRQILAAKGDGTDE